MKLALPEDIILTEVTLQNGDALVNSLQQTINNNGLNQQQRVCVGLARIFAQTRLQEMRKEFKTYEVGKIRARQIDALLSGTDPKIAEWIITPQEGGNPLDCIRTALIPTHHLSERHLRKF